MMYLTLNIFHIFIFIILLVLYILFILFIDSISVEIVLGLDDSLSIKEASKVAADCRDLILTIQDITHVEIHIDIPVKPINDL